MSLPVPKPAAYDDLYSLPDNVTGEIIDGELIATPRPSRGHVYTTSSLDKEIGTPFHKGKGGPGGWIILVEPEIALGNNIIVPDLAGWKKEHFPVAEDHNWISVAPDWVCEIISPGTANIDRVRKMGIYAKHRVPYYWIIDPISKTLEVFENENSKWVVIGSFEGDDKINVPPFHEVEIDLGSLWIENAFKNSPEEG